MNHTQDERHVLIIDGLQGRQAIALEAAAYSVGRDLTNAIVLDFETVSRQHAIFLRVPVPGTNQYRYRLVDGNADGKPSTNGTFINGKRCLSEQLNHGDTILFGRKIKAAYLTVAMAENEFSSYLESIAFQSIKSQTLSPKETLVGTEFSGEQLAQELSKRTKGVELQPLVAGKIQNSEPGSLVGETTGSLVTEKATAKDSLKETVHEDGPNPTQRLKRQQMVAAVVIVLALVTGTGVYLHSQQSPPGLESSPTQAQ